MLMESKTLRVSAWQGGLGFIGLKGYRLQLYIYIYIYIYI